jgi:hypothetical protein
MQIGKFLSSLLPRVEKSHIVEDMRVSIGELENISINNFKQAGEFFRTSKFRSEKVKDLSDAFYRNSKLSWSKQANFIQDIHKALVNIRDNADYTQDIVDKEISSDVINDGLTLKKTMLIRAAEHISFISRFSIDLLNFIYVEEAMAVDAEVEDSLKLSPASERHIVTNINKYAFLVQKYSVKPDDFKKLLSNVPDIVISKSTVNVISGMYDESEIDPFGGPMTVGFTYNPIYHVRLAIAEWQASRYQANKDKKNVLSIRLLHLKMLQDGKSDAATEREIVYLQSRIDKVERYLKEVEESVEV